MNRDQRREAVEGGMIETTDAGRPEVAEKRITDAGAQRLESIRGGFGAFKKGLAERLGSFGRGGKKAALDTVIGILSAPEATVAGGRAVGHAGAEAGRTVGRGVRTGAEVTAGTVAYGAVSAAEAGRRGVEATKRKAGETRDRAVGKARDTRDAAVGKYQETRDSVVGSVTDARDAVVARGVAVREGVQNKIAQTREKIGEGKDAVVGTAMELYDRGAEAHDRFQGKIVQIQESFRSKLAAIREARQNKKEFREYQKLLAKREEMEAKLTRLSELEQKFGSAEA